RSGEGAGTSGTSSQENNDHRRMLSQVYRGPYLGEAATSGMWLQPWRVFGAALIYAVLSLIGHSSEPHWSQVISMRTGQRLQSSEDVPTLLSPKDVKDVKDAISSEKKQRDAIKVIYNFNKDATRKITIGVKSSAFVNMRIGDDSEISA
ncbi:hypothetical protein Tco_0991723, partial [Tanacetum coccineum]